MSDGIEALQVGKWRVGFDHKTGQAVVILEFADRSPLAIMVPIDVAPELGRALIGLNEDGQSSPARPN